MDETAITPPPVKVKKKLGRPRGTGKKNIEQRLNDAMGIAGSLQKSLTPQVLQPQILQPLTSGMGNITVPIDIARQTSEIASDYDFSRATFYNLIQKGTKAIEGMMSVAEESGEPRAYEVTAILIKTVAEATGELIKLQKSLKELQKDQQDSIEKQTVNGDVNQTNVYLSTAEALKMMKDANK